MFRPKPLTVPFVYKSLMEIANISGNASQAKKIGIINKMLACCNPTDNEAKFLIRSLEGKSLRIGLAERTVVVALAHAIDRHRLGNSRMKHEDLILRLEEGARIVKQVYRFVISPRKV